MIDTILKAIAPVLPWVFVGLVVFILFAAVYLFKKLSGDRAEAERTRQGLELELSFFRKLGRVFTRKTDVVVAASTANPNELTISKPIPAVPPPEKP